MEKETINTAVTYFLFALVVVLMIGVMIIFWPLTIGVALIYLFTHGPLKPKGKWQRIAEASKMAVTVELDPVTAVPVSKEGTENRKGDILIINNSECPLFFPSPFLSLRGGRRDVELKIQV